MKSGKSAGFSLIELLVVISVIALLTAMTVKLWGNVSQKVAFNQAVDDLEHIDHWLEEYYATYGHYPDCNNFLWENPDAGAKPPDWDLILEKAPSINAGLPENLCYWIVKKVPESPERDRFKQYKNQIPLTSGEPDHTKDSEDFGFEYGEINWTNVTWSCADPWGREYRYVPRRPDLQSYSTWSVGPDGQSGTGDDVSFDSFTE
jgi:prepilin-type N-terminal cleavage/methylation domain-containing protein